MSTQRKQYSAEFKARVALEALKGLKTVNELASTYSLRAILAVVSTGTDSSPEDISISNKAIIRRERLSKSSAAHCALFVSP